MASHKGLLLLIASTLAAPAPALAHHAMGGATPTSFFQGLASGLAHPVLGPDHLIFLLAVGVLAVSMRATLRFGAAFLCVGSGLAGTSLHLAGLELLGAEALIAMSVILVGVMLLSRSLATVGALAVFLPLAGLAHGYMFAESIIGAEASPLFAYLLGLALVQAAVIAAVGIAVERFDPWTYRARRLGGVAAVIAGVAFLSLNFV